MSKIYLVTFGCDEKFKQSRQRLAKEAETSGWFDDIFVYDPETLREYNKSFTGRGAGYWWWKPVVQSLAMQQIDTDDFLLYLDAGTYINKLGEDIFKEYLNIVSNNSGLLAWNTASIEKYWTKRDLLTLLSCDTPEFVETPQIASNLILYKKNQWTINFINEFVKLCSIEHCVNDDSSYHPNYENFIEHKHDQSVFSLLLKKYMKNLDIFLENRHLGNCPGQDNNSILYDQEVNLVKKWMIDTSQKPRIRKLNTLESLTFPFLQCRLYDNKFTWI